MRPQSVVVVGALLATLGATDLGLALQGFSVPVTPSAAAPGGESYKIEFIENRGQWECDVSFVGTVPGGLVRAERGAIGIQIPTSASGGAYVRMVFEGSNQSAVIEGREQQEAMRHYFLGNEPSKWVRNARSFSQVAWRELYPGIDLILRAESGRAKYDLALMPGADISLVHVRCEGVIGILVDPEDGVLIESPAGPIEQPLGKCWQVLPSGEKRPIEVRVRECGENAFGFELVGRDSTLPTVIDPALLWSTYFGAPSAGMTGDRGEEAVYDSAGDVYVTGETEWPGFPTTPGAYQYQGGSAPALHMFVAKFRGATGQLLYSSVVGGVSWDRSKHIDVDIAGRAVVGGLTGSPDFPTTPGAFDAIKDTFYNDSGFVLRLTTSGNDLEFSTFLEGTTGLTSIYALDIAPSGAVIVGGRSAAPDFPTTPGAFDTSWNSSGYYDGFVTRFDPTGSYLEWSTLLGGTGSDEVYGLVVALDGNISVTGDSADFPTTPGAFDRFHNGSGDVFVARLRADGAALLWATFLGGLNPDHANGIDMLPSGEVVVAGWTSSLNFPTTSGAFQTQHQIGSLGWEDGFVTRVNPTGSALVYSTYFGGTPHDRITSIEVDASGIATITGLASIVPTTPGSFQAQPDWNENVFIARLHPNGTRLLYSSYVGGPEHDYGQGVAVSSTGRVTLIGSSDGGYPVTAASLPYAGGQLDAVVTALDPLLEGVQIDELSVPSCRGPLNLNAEPTPLGSSASFRLYCSQAPPHSFGALAVWLPPSSGTTWRVRPTYLVPAFTNVDGWVETSFPLSVHAAGTQLRFRYAFRNTATCGVPGTISLSNGLLGTAQ